MGCSAGCSAALCGQRSRKIMKEEIMEEDILLHQEVVRNILNIGQYRMRDVEMVIK